MLNFRLGLVTFFSLSLFSAFANEIDTKRIKIEYASPSWNENSTIVDSAFLYVKDTSSGKIVKINLEETEPDSSVFTGDFSIKFGDKGITPEIFIPTEQARKRAKARERFFKNIVKGSVSSNPIFYNEKQKNVFILEVFDTKRQALLAKELFNKQQMEEIKEANTKDVKPVLSDDELELAKEAERKAEELRLKQELYEKERKRIQQEQIALQKLKEQREQMARLKAAERQARIDKANKLSEQGFLEYKKGNYVRAEELFKEASTVDPNNKKYYFYYGVSLYRNQKYNDALVTLNVAQTTGDQEIEKQYYMGLIHSRLKEYPLAVNKFDFVKIKNRPALSASAAFYKGKMLMYLKRYEEAKAEFEWVLDNSKDPKLDNKAEELLEKCIRFIAYEKEQRKRIKFTGTTGAQYDSNILLASDSVTSQGAPTNKAGLRVLATTNLEYKLLKSEKKGWSAIYDMSIIYSLSEDFIAADPFLNAISFPYFFYGKLNNKSYKLTFKPGYEYLMMDGNSEGVRYASGILSTALLGIDWMLINDSSWISTYSLEVRNDDSKLVATVDENADALKAKIGTSQMKFLDNKKKKAIIGTASVTLNNATGSQKKYQRYDIGVVYTSPIVKWKGLSWMTGLSVYDLTYTDHSSNRKDFNITVSGGITRSVSESWSWGTTASYVDNTSNVEANKYNKYSLMGTLTYNWAE